MPKKNRVDSLDENIWKQVERLGGKKVKAPAKSASLPASIAAFIFTVQWPKGSYTADVTTTDGDSTPMQDIRFDANAETDIFEPYPSCQGRSLVSVGTANGHYIIALDLESENMSDPLLELVDPEDSEEECLYFSQPLSQFLSALGKGS